MLKGETQEEFYRWLIEEHKPQEAMYFARSDDYKNQYLGVQYYSVALPHDSLNPGIPVGPPQIMPRSMSLWKLPQYKDATGSIENSNHTVNLVQYYKSL
ncbi:MAG TPA: hypothetical protein VJB13_03695 [Candidatus Nanoarchaeia archaeon]|nr:hypothetical protein [Candidatus Nanoarchaeia archaeon]